MKRLCGPVGIGSGKVIGFGRTVVGPPRHKWVIVGYIRIMKTEAAPWCLLTVSGLRQVFNLFNRRYRYIWHLRM